MVLVYLLPTVAGGPSDATPGFRKESPVESTRKYDRGGFLPIQVVDPMGESPPGAGVN